jgi:hypothetical protein
VDKLEVPLEVRVARERVGGAAWDAAGVAALAFTTLQSEKLNSLRGGWVEKRGGHCDCLGFQAAGIIFGGEITRLKLEVGFIFGHNEVIIHEPGYPRVPVFFDIKERDLNARCSSSLG